MIGIVGTGAMGGALLAGWLAAGWQPGQLMAVEQNAELLAEVTARYGIQGASLAQAAQAEVLVLAVKPHLVVEVLRQAAPDLQPQTIVVSIAAGVTLERLQAAVPGTQPVVRVMPNTPALVGQGVSGIARSPQVSDEQLAQVVALMDAVGASVVVPEAQLDALTAISGSGPAYIFMVAEAMIEAGVHQGLSRDIATQLVIGTLTGSAAMLSATGESATVLRERVTSPAGTTAAALRVLEERGLRAAFLTAVEANVVRSRQL